ncbi:MAG TPA: F0F1 ATP synthase subunit delta [Patescibacteria group bacterium]|nr:F0F1 ATP synthase subunit delta [Patescibacteria group bacterium]
MPRPSTAARRYAEAAFEIARRDGTEDAWLAALEGAARVLESAAVLQLVENPAIPLPQRLHAVRAVLGAVADGDDGAAIRPVGDQLANLVGLLVGRRRASLLPAVATEYRRLLDRQRGVVAALVTSAAPLTAEETEAIVARVATLTGTTVSLRTVIDPALIGGVTVRIGDRLIDASLRGRLERLRDRIVAGAR